MAVCQSATAGADVIKINNQISAQISSSVNISIISGSSIDPEAIAKMKELWMLKHRHQHERPRKVGDGKLTTVIKDLLVQKLESKASVRLKVLRIDNVFFNDFYRQAGFEFLGPEALTVQVGGLLRITTSTGPGTR